MTKGYLRTPSIRGEAVVFVSEDDLWIVPASGGVARRLTANLGPTARPFISPDGDSIAFTGTEEGHAEVYVMPADGGSPKRLTFLGTSTATRGWAPGGRIVFVSDHRQPLRGNTSLHTVGPDGGPPEELPWGPAQDIAWGPDGGVVLGRNTADPARWKRYRGGTAGQVWIDRRGNGTFRQLVDLKGNLASPLWLGSRVYFLSDHEGVGNLYSVRPDGRDIRRHTDHEEYYARFASTDGARIVYQCGAEIWLYDPASGESSGIDVDLLSSRTQTARKFVAAEKFLHGYEVHPNGHSLAVEARGKLFVMPLWEEAVRQYGRPDGVRYRLASWMQDGTTIVVSSDQGGEERLELYKCDGSGFESRLQDLDLGHPEELLPSPTKDVVAVANHRMELVLVDVRSSTATVVERSEHGRIEGLAWSPDGEWLAYAFPSSQQTRSIRVLRAADGRTHQVTRPDFRDLAPAFDPDGKYLYFLSYRTFDPVYDSHFFDLGFPRGSRPYLVTLRADEPAPFLPKPKGFGDTPADETPEKDKEKDKKDDKAATAVRIDLDGIESRVVAFPVPDGRYTRIAAVKGKVLFTSAPVEGSLDVDFFADPEPAETLGVWDFGEQKHEELAGGVSDFTVSRDGSTLVYRSGRRLRAIKAGEKPDPATEKEKPSRKTGWVDLGRLRVSVVPALEWRQMLREAWRLQRDHFWVEDLSGVDWQVVLNRYLPLVDRVATRAEFSDLMWEMQGELGTSHAYEIGGDHRPPPPYVVGKLGADLELQPRTGRWRVAHIVRGDSWDNESSSPLAAPGVNVREGDSILGVNGLPVDRENSPSSRLVHQAGVAVELTIGDARGRNPRRVVVTTLRSEASVRYREWVERNRAFVHEASRGRVGYLHVPDMGAPGFAEFHRYYLSELEREALVVDVRANGGGHVSPLLLEKLARRRIGYAATRWGKPEPYPHDSVSGPIVCLTDEQAGSDGDIFTHAFKLMKLGPVVGKRTWGGVVGINARHRLVDGSITTQPEYSHWFVDVGWGLENYGTDPDVEVDIKPQDYAAGRDPQLDTALRLATQALRKHRPVAPDVRRRPLLALPKLPPRK